MQNQVYFSNPVQSMNPNMLSAPTKHQMPQLKPSLHLYVQEQTTLPCLPRDPISGLCNVSNKFASHNLFAANTTNARNISKDTTNNRIYLPSQIKA